MQNLVFDVDWNLSEAEPPAQCPSGFGTPGTTEETQVTWLLPVGHADVVMTTHRPINHPTTPNWVKRVETCEQDTLGLELWGLEDVRFQRSPMEDSCKPLTELWINTSRARNTDLKTEGVSCEDGSETGKRVEVHPLPTTFWIKHPVPPGWLSRFTNDGALFKSSEPIRHFQYLDTAKGCVKLHEDHIEPEIDATQLVGVEDALRGGACKYAPGWAVDGAGAVQRAAGAAARFVHQGIESAGRIAMEAAKNGHIGVECRIPAVQGEVGISWDIDGWTGQRDRTRFHEAHVTAQSLECGVRTSDDEHGTILEIPSFPGGRIRVDLQSQWWPTNRRAPVDANIPGSLDIPESYLTEPRCTKWNTTNETTCLAWESTREVHERIAENYTADAGRVFEDREEYAVPWEEWADVLT